MTGFLIIISFCLAAVFVYSWVKPIVSGFVFFLMVFVSAGFPQNLSTEINQTETTLSNALHEQGLPFITYYGTDDYRAFNQNWETVQDNSGILYFANGDGILMYDGVHWEIVPLPNHAHAKSITFDKKNNRVYAGALGEFGYLEPDETGKMNYVSLVSYLDEDERDFSTIWESIATPDGIFFKTYEALYRWDGIEFTIWETQGSRLFYFRDTLYTFTYRQGIKYLDEEDNIRLIPAGDVLADEAVTALMPYGDHALLAGTYENGLFLFEDGTKKQFLTEADDYFSNTQLYTAIQLSDGSYAFGTLTEGMIVLDASGRQLLRVSRDEGMVSGIVHRLYQDRQGIIWVSLNDGIAKIEYPSPFTIFDDRAGINSRIQLVTRYQDQLLAGTDTGLYVLGNDPESGLPFFNPFHDIRNKVWDLFDFDGILLIGLQDDVYQIREDSLIFAGDWNPSSFFRSEINRNRLFIPSGDGLRSIYHQNGEWIDEGLMDGITGATYAVVEMDSGDLWLLTSEAWLWRLSFKTTEDAQKLQNPVITRYDSGQGLPEDRGGIYFLDNTLYYSAFNDQETYQYNPAADRFEPANNLFQLLNLQDEQLYINHIYRDKNIWFTTHRDGRILKWVGWKQDNPEYIVENLEQSRILDDLGGSRSLFYESRDSVLWLTGDNSILQHDLKFQENRSESFQTVMKRVIFKNDSLLVQGNYFSSRPEVPFLGNSFRFQYASPDFHSEHANRYQYFLEGFSEEWSGWTTETQRDFTNLPEGDYLFRVRGQNIHGQISEEAVFAFTILPPWYRSWWAYTMYTFLFIGLVLSLVKWRSYKLEQENVALQLIVEERTRQVKQQAEQLKELDQAKSRFFANISHEFRTPLTLILGQVQQLESGAAGGDPAPVYSMIRRNGNRVLSLVNQLLDLSTLEAGKMKLQVEKTDLVSFLKPIVASYESLAESRKIIFSYETDEKKIPIYMDRDKVEKAVQNVISNAFKFTPEGGQIAVFASGNENECAHIKVEDNGRGIAPDQLDKIFDRFYSGDHSDLSNGGSSGIGLALTKELITLHKGSISVESEVESGSCFTISLPLGREPYADPQIVESPESSYSEPVQSVIPDEIKQPKSLPAKHEDDTAKSSETPQVLIVEDNADMRQYIRQILDPHYRVDVAVHGSDGLEKATELIPDLVLSDVMMPGMNGMELCSKLKNDVRTSHIPVVLLTAKAGKDSKLEGLSHHADDYLTKPFDSEELLAILRNRIEQRVRLRERFSREVTLQPKDIAITSADEKFLQRAIDIVEKNLDNFDFSVQDFVENMHFGHTQVSKKLKALTDSSPVQFIRSQRLKRAAQKITAKEDTISQIAYSVGFNNLSYFAKCFKEQFGKAPSEYTGEEIKSDQKL